MDEIYVTYVDDEHVDNHDYDDTTDDDHDNNNDIYARALNARVNTNIFIFVWAPWGPPIDWGAPWGPKIKFSNKCLLLTDRPSLYKSI